MADDSPFTQPPNGSGQAPAAQTQPGTPGTIRPEDMAAAFQKAVKPLQDQLAAQAHQIESLTHALASVQQNPSRQAATQEGSQGAHGGSFLDEFVANPEKTLEGSFTKMAQKVLGPYMNALGTAAQRSALQKQRDAFEARYGPNQWDEIIQPRLEHVLQNVAEPLRMSEDHIMAAVASIKGSPDLEPVLDAAREKHMTTQREQETAARRSRGGAMLGPGRIGPTGDDTSIPEDGSAEVLASFARHGINFNERDFQASRKARAGRSLSFDDWEKARFPKDTVKTPEPEERSTDIPKEKLAGLP